MADNGNREYRLEVGDFVIGLVCDSAEYAASLAVYFDRPCSEKPADISLDLIIVPHTDMPEIPNSLFTTKSITPEGFNIADGLISGRLDLIERRGELRVKNILTKGQMPRVFEQVLYQVFYSIMDVRRADALLIHSSGVLAAGGGYLFVGPSEAGKSTVAACSTDHIVLNDEMNLVEFNRDGAVLHGTPFNGFFRDKQPGRAPLKGLFLLAHGPEHEVLDLGRAEAIAAVATQVVPPVGLSAAIPADIQLRMVDLASRLCAAAPVKRLSFTPDSGFWPVILAGLEDQEST